MLKLKSPNSGFPPGGWPYIEPKSGFKCNGFEGTPKMQAEKIISHRRANPHLFPKGEAALFDMNSVIQEVYQQKFSTHPQLFVGQSGVVPSVNKTPSRKKSVQIHSACKECGGTSFEPIYCKTCAGSRITGHKCSACGKEV